MKSDKEIKELLGKYYAANTTLQEENWLRNYFTSDNVSEELKKEKQYFLSLISLMETPKLYTLFDEKMMRKIEKLKRNKRKRISFYFLSGVAALLLILITIWTGTQLFSPKPVYGTVKNPQMAFAQTKMVLQTVAAAMNRGLKPTREATTAFYTTMDKTKDISNIKQPFDELKQMREVARATRLMQSSNRVFLNLELKKSK